jgi:hypothetical protein
MNRDERIDWLFRHEAHWSDLPLLAEKAVKDGVYSPKLSNIVHCLECLIFECQNIKKRKPSYFEPLQRRSEEFATRENIQTLLKRRDIIDILLDANHPSSRMAKNGFTFYDYILWMQRRGDLPDYVIKEVNVIFAGGDVSMIN